jgi:hypothetical protein
MAIDVGKLQNLIFDNQHLWTHKMLQRFIGIILSLGPIKRKLADEQLRSKFLVFARKLREKRKVKVMKIEVKK